MRARQDVTIHIYIYMYICIYIYKGICMYTFICACGYVVFFCLGCCFLDFAFAFLGFPKSDASGSSSQASLGH